MSVCERFLNEERLRLMTVPCLKGHGDRCPECQRGKVYPLHDPGVLVRIGKRRETAGNDGITGQNGRAGVEEIDESDFGVWPS